MGYCNALSIRKEDETKMNHCFLMNAEMAEEFFKRCVAANANTEEERTAILLDVKKENKAEYIGSTELGRATLAKKLNAAYIGKKVKPSVKPEGK